MFRQKTQFIMSNNFLAEKSREEGGAPVLDAVAERIETGSVEAQTLAGPKARWRAVFPEAMRLVWHRIGLVMAISLTWTFLLGIALGLSLLLTPVLPMGIRYFLMALLGTAVGSLALTGACFVGQRLCARLDTDYGDFWVGVRSHVRPALALGSLDAVLGSLFGVNLWFYGRSHASGSGGAGSLVALLLCGYVALFWLMMAIYHFPLLVAQETGVFDAPDRRARRGAPAVFRRAFFVVLGSPFFSLAITLTCAAILALLLLTRALPALLWLGMFGILSSQATRALLIQFGVVPVPVLEEVVPDEKFRIASENRKGA